MMLFFVLKEQKHRVKADLKTRTVFLNIKYPEMRKARDVKGLFTGLRKSLVWGGGGGKRRKGVERFSDIDRD